MNERAEAAQARVARNLQRVESARRVVWECWKEQTRLLEAVAALQGAASNIEWRASRARMDRPDATRSWPRGPGSGLLVPPFEALASSAIENESEEVKALALPSGSMEILVSLLVNEQTTIGNAVGFAAVGTVICPDGGSRLLIHSPPTVAWDVAWRDIASFRFVAATVTIELVVFEFASEGILVGDITSGSGLVSSPAPLVSEWVAGPTVVPGSVTDSGMVNVLGWCDLRSNNLYWCGVAVLGSAMVGQATWAPAGLESPLATSEIQVDAIAQVSSISALVLP